MRKKTTSPASSPIGTSVAENIRLHEMEDAEFAAVRARLARCEAIARLVIRFRMDHKLTQEQLADLMGTTPQVISRLESGQHWPSLDTLRRLAESQGDRLVIGFSRTGAQKPDLVTV